MLSFHTVEELRHWKAGAKNAQVRVRQFSAFRYVYRRIYAPYGNTRLVDAYHSLIAWLAERRTETRDVVFIGMSLDDPPITPSENCRYDLGVGFPQQPGGLLGDIVDSRQHSSSRLVSLPAQPECDARGLTLRDFTPQQIVSFHCVGDIAHVERAWHYLYRIWLPTGRPWKFCTASGGNRMGDIRPASVYTRRAALTLAAATLPAFGQSGKGENMAHPVIHFEIGCRDRAKTERFFTDLFGWNIQENGPASTINTGGDKGIPGHIISLGHEPQHYTIFYVEVEDVQAYLDKAAALGGKMIVPPIKTPTGTFAWLADLDGNTIGLFQPVP